MGVKPYSTQTQMAPVTWACQSCEVTIRQPAGSHHLQCWFCGRFMRRAELKHNADRQTVEPIRATNWSLEMA